MEYQYHVFQMLISSAFSILRQQGIDVIETNTAEGRQLKAFLAQQREKLAVKLDQPIARIYTTEDNFETMRIKHGNNPNTIVFTPAQSKSMNAVQQGSYITVGDGGEHIYRGSDTQSIESRQQGTIAVASVMVGLDIYNTFQVLHHWKSGDENLEKSRNIADALGALTGSTASIGELWKSLYESKQLNHQANKTTALARRVNQSQLFNVGVFKVLPVTAAVSGILVSGYDAYIAVLKGDDVAWAHMTMAASGATLFLSFISGAPMAAILGPLSIGLALAAITLQYTWFKEDNMLDTWLEKGPFSEQKSARYPRFKCINWDHYHHHSEVSDRLKQRMGIERHSVWFGGSSIGKLSELKDTEGRYRKVLLLPLYPFGLSLILDQNYQLLGFKRLYANQPLDQVAFEDLTGEIFVTDNGHKRLLGRIGEQLGDTSWGIIDRLVDSFPSLISIREHSDTSVRFEDTWGDEDKFTEPMKRYPAASLELLLNGLYPLKANFELMPVEKKLVGRTVGRSGRNKYEMKGNRAKVTVDLPYFIEGESVLTIEIRVARESEEQDKDGLPVIMFGKGTDLKVPSLSALEVYESDEITGAFKSIDAGKQKLIIVSDFSMATFGSEEDVLDSIQINNKIELECWIKLNVTQSQKVETKSVNMPWRGRDMWLEDTPSIQSVQKSWFTITASDTLRS